MTHEDRLALILRPFFITTFSTSYPWSGRNTGGYLFPDVTGGRWLSVVDDSGGRSRSSRGLGASDGYSLLDLQRRIIDNAPVTKYSADAALADVVLASLEENEP